MSDIDDELFALAGGDEEAEVEEGEASEGASSPNSIGSGAMDESDSESDAANDDNERSSERDPDVPYPLDGQFIDRKDREHIMSLPQLQRERILGERSEEMNKAKFAADLRHRAKQMEKSAVDGPRKRKASSIEPEDASRQSSRQKVKAKTNDKLEAYKREREQRGQQRERHNDRRDGHRRSSSGDRKSDSDVDAEGESEVDWDEGAKKATREELPATLHDFESIRLGRTFMSKVCFWPQFDESITGAFVRVGVAQVNGRTQYKMAQIKGIQTGKPYVFDGEGGKKFGTDQYIVIQHGSGRKPFMFQNISNSRYEENDFRTYRDSLAESNSKLPTKTFLEKKIQEVKNFEQRFWTDPEITERIAKSQKFNELVNRISRANAAPVQLTNHQIEAQRIAELNRRNRAEDSKRVSKALIEERRAEKKAAKRREEEWKRKKAEEEEKAAKEEAKKNRLKVPGIDDLFEGSDRSRSATPMVQKKEKVERKGLPTFRAPKMDDDIIAAVDFGVDIEL